MGEEPFRDFRDTHIGKCILECGNVLECTRLIRRQGFYVLHLTECLHHRFQSEITPVVNIHILVFLVVIIAIIGIHGHGRTFS